MTGDPGVAPEPMDEPYLLGTAAEEGRRLEAQHRVWSAETGDLWDRAGFGPGTHLLDLGCGPGCATIDLARRVGTHGRVLAVDESAPFIHALDREKTRLGFHHLATRVARVEALTLEPASLDGVFARWLFCFLADPGAVIARVVPALRPGGRFAVQDYLNYRATKLEPRSPAFDRVIAAVQESWRRTGGDLDVGGRLPALLAAHGCRVRELVPMVHLARPGEAFWDWPKRFFFSYVPRLVEDGVLTAAERTAFETEWRAREQSPAAFLSTPPLVGIIAEKE